MQQARVVVKSIQTQPILFSAFSLWYVRAHLSASLQPVSSQARGQNTCLAFMHESKLICLSTLFADFSVWST